MKPKLTDREITLVARMLRIGMAQESIARIVRVTISDIEYLRENSPECKASASVRAREAILLERLPKKSMREPDEEFTPRVPIFPVMPEAKKAAELGFRSIAELRAYMAGRYEITLTQLDEASRNRRYKWAREATVCAARMLWPHLSLLEIGRHFANRRDGSIHFILSKHKLPTASVSTGMKHAA